MAKAPMADEGKICPFHKKDMSLVCHKCPWWTQLRGTNPQTGSEVDEWGCAIGMMPMLLCENSKESRQTGAAVESFRNELVRSNWATVEALTKIANRKPSSDIKIVEDLGDE